MPSTLTQSLWGTGPENMERLVEVKPVYPVWRTDFGELSFIVSKNFK